MRDLVERMRKEVVQDNFVGLLDEAADRIEALEVALRHVEDALGYDKNEGKSLAVRESNAHDAWKIARAALAPEQDK